MGRPGLTQHRKFRRLERALGSPILARGALELLWDVAYENGDEYLGSTTDVEAAARWDGQAGSLTKALLEAGGDGNAGFIEEIPERGGHYRVHNLFENAPEYVQKRMERELKRKQRGVSISDLRREAGKRGRAVVSGQTSGKHPANDEHLLANGGHLLANGATPAPAPAPVKKNHSSKSDDFDLSPESALEKAVEEVWNYYIVTIGRNPKTFSWLPKRKSMGLVRLRELQRRAAEPKLENAVAMMKLCVDRLAESAFHNGKNQSGRKYRDWEILFRSTEQMEKWLNDDSFDDEDQVTGKARVGAGRHQ